MRRATFRMPYGEAGILKMRCEMWARNSQDADGDAIFKMRRKTFRMPLVPHYSR